MLKVILFIIGCLFIIAVAFILFIFFYSVIGIANIKMYISNRLVPWNLNEVEKYDGEFFETISRKLEEAGFKHDNDYRLLDGNMEKVHDGKNQKELYIRRFVHKELATSADIMHSIMRRDVKEPDQVTTVTTYQNNLGLDTVFQSGLCINSMTQVEPQLFEDPDSIRLIYTNFEDIDQLIQEHLKLVQEKAETEVLIVDVVNMTAEDYINKMFKLSNETQVERKILKYDANNNCYKFTFKGVMQAFFKYIKFECMDKKKLVKQANKFVAKSDVVKKKMIPVALYYANTFFSMGVVWQGIHILRRGMGNLSQQLFSGFICIGFLICMVITLLYKSSDKNKNR